MVNGSSRFLNEINGKIDWSNVLNQPTIGTGSVTSVAASGTGGISVSGSPITTSGTLSIGVNGSTVINNLTTGDADAQRTDYIVAQYAGGGTTSTTYHRRPLSKIFAALNKSDITTALGYTPIQTESDPTVPSWAKASSKPSYSASEISGLGTAATKDVPSSGNASSTQVVMGSDTRLTNSRPSSDVVQTYSSTSTVPISGKGVAAALATLPSPMVFKGTLGTGGTITALPVNGTATIGDTYKVITAGTYASQAAKIGDVFICQTKTSSANTWAYVPSGDDTVTDTWRNIKVNGTEKIGTGISTGAVDFVNGTNTTVNYNATGNKISIDVPNAPVSSVAGKTGDVTLTNSDVGLGNVGNFKAVSTVANQGLTDTEKSSARANIGAGTSSLTLGTTSSTAYRGDRGNTAYSHATDSSRLTTATASGLYKVASTAQGHIASLTAVTSSDIASLGIPNESKTAASGGTDLSLVTTGEKYEWDNADTKVDQMLSTDTTSHPILMSSAPYNGTGSGDTHYIGDVLRNNNIYANPSTGSITSLGWITSGDGTGTDSAKLVRAWNKNGYAGVMAGGSTGTTEPLLGVMTKGDNESEGSYMIWRAATGTSAALTTSGTYIGGYNYNNAWENFLVQGRSGRYWGTIPAVTSNNGILEIGKHIDFHTSSGSTADNDYRISCTGSGAATYSGTWTKSSSIKIKENIEDMDLDEAKELFNLRPVKFDYKEGFGQKDQRGLIAEEVAEVLPKLVVAEVGEEGTEDWCPASVDYIGVVPYLIKIVQEQQKEIDELKKKVR